MKVTRRLRLRLHHQEEFNPAHFAPFPLRPLEEIADQAPLPKGPTLYLYAPAYAPDGGFRALRDLPVDSAEGLFNALLLAYFELEILPSSSALRQRIFDHAEALLPELAPEYRVRALLQGLADFGSHVLAVANRLNLLEARARASGKNLCPLLDRPGMLFGLWEHIFQEGLYWARYYRSSAVSESAGGWQETSVAISREDKEILIRDIFRSGWKGTRREDLAPRFCPSP